MSQLSDLALHRLDLGALIRGLPVFAAAIDVGLFDPTPQRVPATSDLGRDRHDRCRLIGILVLMFQNHPNCAGAHLSQNLFALLLFSIGSIHTYFGASGKLGEVHYGGALVLFKRNLSVAVPNAKMHRRANWYMRLKIGGRKGYVTRSTKLTIYEDAYEYAKSELLRLQQAAPTQKVSQQDFEPKQPQAPIAPKWCLHRKPM